MVEIEELAASINRKRQEVNVTLAVEGTSLVGRGAAIVVTRANEVNYGAERNESLLAAPQVASNHPFQGILFSLNFVDCLA